MKGKGNSRKRPRSASAKAGAGEKGKRRINPRKLFFAVLTVAFGIYFIYVMIWQQVTISKKNREIEALEEKISAAGQETEQLEAELDNLNDPEYLERVARERLGLVRPNERVFVDANKSESNQADSGR